MFKKDRWLLTAMKLTEHTNHRIQPIQEMTTLQFADVSAASVTVQPSAVVIEDKERSCDSLLMCIVTVLSHGLRSGGGVGDVLRKPSKEVQRTGAQQ